MLKTIAILACCSLLPLQAAAPTRKILLAITNQATLGSRTTPTGAYLSEITHAHSVFTQAGFQVDFVSPKGGKVPLDGVQVEDALNSAFLGNPSLVSALQASLPASKIESTHYCAIYFAGGHGVMWDFPEDANLARLISEIYLKNGVVGAVCHGPAALVNVKVGSEYLVKGKRVSCFTNEEEAYIQRTQEVPFALETRLLERGAVITKAHLLQPHVEVSEHLVTGQNPASAKGVAQAMVQLLHKP